MVNTNSIDKIISALSYRDYKAKMEKLTKNQRDKIKTQQKTLSDFGGYSIGSDTEEAIQIKNDYLAERITEEEYKAYCLKYNLLSLAN